MRARRAAFAALAVACLLLVFYSGDAIWLWILTFQAVILIVGALNVALTFMYLSVEQTLAAPTAARGGNVALKLMLYNTSIMPYGHVILDVSTIESGIYGESRRVFVAIPPMSRRSLEIELNCPYRGEYAVGITRAEVVDLFGLIRMTRERSMIEGAHRLLPLVVYPRLYIPEGELYMSREDDNTSGMSQSRAEELSQISQIRDYREGDQLKRVHWKLSMRLGELLVKEYDGSVNAQNLIMLDCSNHGLAGADAATFEDLLCEAASSFAKRFCDTYSPVRLTTYGAERIELEGGTPSQFEAMHYHLARVKFGGDIPLADALKLESERGIDSLVLITGTPPTNLFERLCSLADGGCHISLALAEPYTGDAEHDAHTARMINELMLRGVVIASLGGEARG